MTKKNVHKAEDDSDDDVTNETTKSTMKTPAVSGPADDTSVRQFVDMSKELVNSILGKDFVGVFKKAGEILNVVGDMYGMYKASPEAKGSAEGSSVTDNELDEIKGKLDHAKAFTNNAKSNNQGVMSTAEERGFDPTSIVVIVDLVLKVLEWIRKRRNPTT